MKEGVGWAWISVHLILSKAGYSLDGVINKIPCERDRWENGERETAVYKSQTLVEGTVI